jgi:hypothetical protein
MPESISVDDDAHIELPVEPPQPPQSPSAAPRVLTPPPLPSTPTLKDTETDTVADQLDKILEPNDSIRHFRVLSDTIDSTLWDTDTSLSTMLDIMAVYLKGQKVLYTEAKAHCERRLLALMIPTIVISGLCTVLNLSINHLPYGPNIISGLTALSGILLSIINYLKLDGKAEAHKITAYQFDKLQTYCEFNSGKVMFLNVKTIDEVVKFIQEKVDEIKENNQWIIPEAVRFHFPQLYGTNIFRELKKLENEENKTKTLLVRIYTDLKEMRANQTKTKDQEFQIQKLEIVKEKLLLEYIDTRNKYFKLDTAIQEELAYQIKRGSWYRNPCSWFLT